MNIQDEETIYRLVRLAFRAELAELKRTAPKQPTFQKPKKRRSRYWTAARRDEQRRKMFELQAQGKCNGRPKNQQVNGLELFQP